MASIQLISKVHFKYDNDLSIIINPKIINAQKSTPISNLEQNSKCINPIVQTKNTNFKIIQTTLL